MFNSCIHQNIRRYIKNKSQENQTLDGVTNHLKLIPFGLTRALIMRNGGNSGREGLFYAVEQMRCWY